MTREEFEEKCIPLHDRYDDIFYEALKGRALDIGLSEVQRKELCGFGTPWDLYTDFFSKLDEELNRRYENGYYDINDLFNPSTKNLDSQITEEIIKKLFLEDVFYSKYRDTLDYLSSLNIYHFYEKFHNNELESFIKWKIPLHSFGSEIPFKCTEKDLLDAYNKVFSMPRYPQKAENVALVISGHVSVMYRKDFIGLYEKYPDRKDLILSFLKKTVSLFSDFSDDILYGKSADENGNIEVPELNDYYKYPIDEVGYSIESDSEFIKMDDGIVDKFERYLLEIFKKYKDDIIGDIQITCYYFSYIVEKLKGLSNTDYLIKHGICKRGWKNYISWDKISNLIGELKDNKDIYEILKIYYMLYFDILNREEYYQFIKEVLHRMKKISDQNNKILLGLKEYLNYILGNLFIDDNLGNKPEYFDSISEDLKEVLGEKDYKKIELLFSSDSPNEGDENIRHKYRIGLIFGDPRSKKAYDLYCNDQKNEKDFTERQLSKKQFDILAEEYYEQQDLDIENKLKFGKLDFVLVFETDHETRMRNLMKIYPNRIIVCNIPGQHFSHEQFRKMLDLGLRNLEGV